MAIDDPGAGGDFRLLEINVATSFVLTPSGRIERESAPDNSPGPRLFLAGCVGGNILRLRHDVGPEVVLRAQALAETETPWSDPSAPPNCLSALIEAISVEAPANAASPALIYQLPRGLFYDAGATITRWDTTNGRHLLARLAEEGMPQHLTQAGFVSLDDFWEPWCAVTVDGEIAALAFAARIGARSAEVGVYTFPGFRGSGLAAAITANWSSLPSLADHELFYSTSATNRSSQRVAERLGLRRFGVSVRVN